MNVTSSSKDRSAEIDRCLSMIVPSASDESKFVGMLILPKLLDQNNTNDIERVFNGMNFKFIERLLRTHHQTDAQVPDPVLKDIAVNILGCFARYDSLATQQPMVDRIPGLSTVLDPLDETEMTKETLQILIHIAVNKEGLVKMLDPDALKNVFHVLLETKSEECRDLASQLIINVYSRSLQLLSTSKIPSLYSGVKYSLNTFISILSKTLNNDQRLLKFKALDMLTIVLNDIPPEMMKQVKAEQETKLNKWLEDLLDGLRQLLTSKLADTQRDKSIALIGCLLRHFGNDWFFKSLLDTKSTKRKKEKSGSENDAAVQAFAKANFPALFIHLVAIEAKLMLDDIEDKYSREYNEGKTITNLQRQQRQEIMIPIYFEIIENAMEFLAVNAESNGMDAEMLLKIRNTLSELMDVVSLLVKLIQDTKNNDIDNDLIAQACIRVLSIWMAEEGLEMPE